MARLMGRQISITLRFLAKACFLATDGMDRSRNRVTAVLLAPHERLMACLPVWTLGWRKRFRVGSGVWCLGTSPPARMLPTPLVPSHSSRTDVCFEG